MMYRLILVVLLLGIANFWGFSSPNGFLKCANFIKVAELPALGASGPAVDPADLLFNIPYDWAAPSPSLVEPDERERLVFERGRGNCAYMSRGLARRLQRMGVPYQIVWIMNRHDTREGSGHTVVAAPLSIGGGQSVIGIIDMLEGGVPSTQGRPLTRELLLTHKRISEVAIEPFNPRADTNSPYYGSFLEDAVIGITRGEELNLYFNIIKTTYIDLQSHRLEKLMYNLTGIVLGLFPSVYITGDEIRRFDGWFQFEIALARTMIWACRILLVMLLIDSAIISWRWLQRYVRPLVGRVIRRPKTTPPAPLP
jgi:hypothetical protein